MSAVGMLPGDPDGFTPSDTYTAAKEEPPPPQYPEHDKMSALRSRIDVVTEFLEWAEGEGYVIGKPSEDPFWDCYQINPAGIESLLAQHFDINRNRLEQEKQAMLEELRRMNEVGP